MRSITFAAGFVVCLASSAIAQDEGFRFFFDTKGTPEASPRLANDPLSFTNPVFANPSFPDAGTRLYLCLGYGTDNQNFHGINLVITVFGAGVIRSGSFYNHLCNPANRWQAIPTPSPTPGFTSWAIGSAFKVGAAGYGARNNDSTGFNGPDLPGSTGPTQSADSHFRADDGSPFGTTLLGYVDVDYIGPFDNLLTVKLSNGTSDNAGVTIGNSDFVYFGFGDAGTINKSGRTSALPDARMIPEPATIGLLVFILAASRRRR